MKRFEYVDVKLLRDIGAPSNVVAELLNSFGEQGWQVVHVHRVGGEIYLWLMREKP